MNYVNLIDITQFSKLEGVVDLIYNPRRTILLLQAEMMEIPHCDGLPFLVAQGVEAANHFRSFSYARHADEDDVFLFTAHISQDLLDQK